METMHPNAIDSEYRFQAAIDAVRKRVPVPKGEWEAMTKLERENAFTVARVTEARVLQSVLDAVESAVTNGLKFADFKEDVSTALIEQWGGEIPGRLETIFRTNLQTSYNEGRHAIYSAPTVKEARPYLRCDGVNDDRECDECEEFDGVVRPQEDWANSTPPYHYGCRHVLTPLSQEEAEAEGIDVSMTDVELDGDFGQAPSKDGEDWNFDLSGFSPELRAELEALL
jgi:uncharacterized protein with gpF-like domain